MATWADFAANAGEIASAAQRIWQTLQVGYLATVRADGAPRVHPITPVLADGHLYVSVDPNSPKHGDLERDGRYALHTPPAREDEEVMLRGRALQVTDAETRAAFATAAPHALGEHDVVYELRIDIALWTTWRAYGSPEAAPIFKRWFKSDLA